jgi:hypothetical protein
MAGFLDRLRAAVSAFRFIKIEDAAPATGGGSVKRDPTAVVVKHLGLAADFNREAQGPSDFDLNDVTNAYEREALVRQAVDRYVELIFKAGWDLTGKNQAAVDYVKLRLAYMAEATQIPTEQLLLEIAEDLVLYHNVILLKARAKDQMELPPGLKAVGLGGMSPVSGYFPADVTTFKNVRDKNGVVKRWEQEVEGQEKPVNFKPQDVVFFYMKRRKGKAWGTPFLIPVLDDIRALRQAEEHVLRLIYRNLFPFFHYQVGVDKAGLEGTDEEVLMIEQRIQNMDLEAGIVTTERHKITSVAANQIIDAKAYLQYFFDRAVMGLGVPKTLLGFGDTANRATADQLSVEMRDRIKAIQRVLGTFFDQFIIHELLLEGGFDPIMNEMDNVDFVFREIDTDGLIKQHNMAVSMYEHNTITEDEMRALLGRDPILDRAGMFMNLVTIPTAEAAAAQKAAAEGTKDLDNKNKPTNQSGTKLSPKKSAKASREYDAAESLRDGLGYQFDHMTDEVCDLIKRIYEEPSRREMAGKELATILAVHGQAMGMSCIEGIADPETSTLAEIAIARIMTQVNESAVQVLNDISQSSVWAQDSFQVTCSVLRDRIDLLVAHIYPKVNISSNIDLKGGEEDQT